MDTLTQMALGAVIGQAIGYKKLGWRAPVYGAIGGLIPDLDVLYADRLSPYGDWLYHRHITHSVFFAPLIAPLLGWLTWLIHKKQPGHYRTYGWVWFWSILTHPLLDTATIFGTQLLAPFSDARFSISAMSIIDPIYSLILLIPLLLAALPRLRPHIPLIAALALVFSTLFIAHGWLQNKKAHWYAVDQLRLQRITPDDVAVYTTIFQPYLRRVVVRQTIGGQEWLRVGFISSLKPGLIAWTCQKQTGAPWREAILHTQGGRIFNWFADGELSMVRNGNQITVMDARYGTPGPSVFGFWGLIFSFNGINMIDVNEEPTYVRAPREATLAAIKGLFRAAYGLPNDFLPNGDSNCP